MTDIEGQESYTDHDGGEFSAVNVRVVATWPAPTFVENLAISRHRPWVSPSMRMARSGQRVGPFARALALYHGQRHARRPPADERMEGVQGPRVAWGKTGGKSLRASGTNRDPARTPYRTADA